MSNLDEKNSLEIMIFGRRLAGSQIFVGLIILAILIWITYLLIILLFGSWESRGQFGDMFGALNALFAAFAFVGLIYAILLQREELKLQREELRLAREELTQQTKVISEQLKAMQSSYDFEQRKAEKESEPILIRNGGQKYDDRKVIEIMNYGSPITDLGVEILKPKNLEVTISPLRLLGRQDSCHLVFKGSKDELNKEIHFRITFTNKIGTHMSKAFMIPRISTDLIPLEEEIELIDG